MNNSSRAAPFHDFDDTTARDAPPPPIRPSDRDPWRNRLILDAIPGIVMNGSTFKAMRLGGIHDDTCPISYDPLQAATMDVTMSELLSRVMVQYTNPSSRSVQTEGIDEQRLLNRKFYEEFRTEIDTRYNGRVVVIANGAIAAVADSFEAVKDIADNAEHRLVFRAGGKKWQTRRTRLPISRK